MDEQVRQGLGERFAARLKARERRRPRMGFAPEFFARLGLEDPWAAPDTSPTQDAGGDGFVFLSAQPYYAMLRRLAASRRRREKRLADFEARRAGTHMRAAQRRWPGETPMGTTRLARLAIDDLILPPPIATANVPATESVEEASAAPARWSRRNEPTPAIKSAWLGASHTPARVARGTATTTLAATRSAGVVATAPARSDADHDRGEVRSSPRSALRPLDRAGARAAQPNPTRRVLEQALATATPVQAERLRRVVEIIEHLPAEEAVAVVRRVVRGVAARHGDDLDTGIALAAGTTPRATARAALRADTVVGREPVGHPASDLRPAARNVGLRPVLSRSPAMALAASADTDRAASGTLAEAAHADALPAPRAARPVRARTSLEHVAARERASTPRAASVLPVAVPRVATPSRSADTTSQAARPGVSSRRVDAKASERTSERGSAPVASLDTPVPSVAPATASRRPASAHALTRDVSPARAEDPRTVVTRGLASTGSALPSFATETPRTATTANRTATASTPRSLRTAPAGTVLAAPETSAAAAGAVGTPTVASRAARVSATNRREDVVAAHVASPAPTVRALARAQVDTRSVVPRAMTAPHAEQAAPERPSRTAALAARAVVTQRQALPRDGAPAPEATATTRLQPPAGVRATRMAKPEATLALPQTDTTPLEATPTAAATPTAMATRAPEPRAVTRRASTPMAAHAAQRAEASSSSYAPSPTPASPHATASRAPTGPLRFARGLTTMDLARAEVANLDADALAQKPARATSRRDIPAAPGTPSTVAATRRSARALPDLGTLLARAEAGQASVTGDAVVRIAGQATGTPFVTAREAKRRGLQVVATERGLVATHDAAEVSRTGENVPRGRAARDAFTRGSTRSAARARVDTQHVVPVEVVAASANTERETNTSTRSVLTQAPVRTRATARALARNEVGTATAYRGALRSAPLLETVRADAPSEADAVSSTTLAGTNPTGARRAAERSQVRGEAASRRARTPDADALRTVQAPTTATGASGTLASDGAETTGAENAPATSNARRARGTFDERMARVAEGRTDGATGWIDRAEGSPRLSTVSSLIQALARASSNEDVVRVIAARGELSTEATRLPLDAPAVQVIQQIRDEVRTAAEPVVIAPTETRASRLSAPEATALSPRALASGGSDDSLRRRVRSSAVRSAEASARRATGAEDRLSKLVRRLQDLVHLAEDQAKLAEARGQVRMAEDSAQARSEGQGAVADSGGARHAKVDIEALGREVLDVVTKELELRRARRMEDDDASPWW